ncbi:MAG: toll/interleukin-1 receptor domain-containing protein [Bacteroidia bacterium]|jgi:hypothetical protein|nr:toll/interleukin-1 receptor domain-containing protein [Bacteroidia bacterium]
MSTVTAPQVFISYDRRDQLAAREICEFIRDCSCEPFIDYADILPGDRWRKKSMKQLQLSQVVVLIISPHSVNSRSTVYEEFQQALQLADEGLLEVIPICIMPVQLPAEIAGYHTEYWDGKGKSSLRIKLKKISENLDAGLIVGGLTLASLVAGGLYWWKKSQKKKNTPPRRNYRPPGKGYF